MQKLQQQPETSSLGGSLLLCGVVGKDRQEQAPARELLPSPGLDPVGSVFPSDQRGLSRKIHLAPWGPAPGGRKEKQIVFERALVLTMGRVLGEWRGGAIGLPSSEASEAIHPHGTAPSRGLGLVVFPARG